MASQASRKRAGETPVIPDRLYFKIGDVARICGVETYVLRFWESQFPQLKPNKSGTGQRLYRRRDVELALEIKRLVHGEGYTLAGARQALATGVRKPEAQAMAPQAVPATPQSAVVVDSAQATQTTGVTSDKLAKIRAELRAIADMLTSDSAAPAAPQPIVRRERPKIVKPRPDSGSLFPL